MSKQQKRFSQKFLYVLFLILGTTYSKVAFSQDAGPLSFTLQQAQEYAIKNNLNVRNATIDVDIAQKVIWENTAMGLPQLDGTVGYTNNLSLATTLIPAEFFGGDPGTFQEVKFGTQHNSTASITANQLIFNGPYIVALQAAKIYKKVSEQTLERTENDVREMVAQNYYLALLAGETIEVLKENQQNLEKILLESKELYKIGFVEEIDVDQLQVNLTMVKNGVRSMERQLEISLNLLKYQMGVNLEAEIILSENLGDIMESINPELVLMEDFKVNNHIDFRLLNTQEQLAFLDLKRTKAESWPTLTAFYTNKRTALRNEFNFFDFEEKWFPSSMVGVSLNIPIFASGMRYSQISQRKLTWEKTKNTKKNTVRGLALENQQAKYDFANALEKYHSERKNLEIARKVFDKTAIKYKEGVSSSLDLTQVNNQYLQTQTNYVTALVELLNAKIRLDKSLNQL